MSNKIKSVDIIEKPPSVHVTCYAYGDMHSAVLTSWIDLANYFAQRTRYAALRTIREDALISRSRCRATKFFLDDDKDVWIQLDHDIQFSTADLMIMADLAHKHQAAVCMPYSCRALPPRPAYRPKPDATPLEDEPSLTPVLFFASGAVAIPRKALEQSLEILATDAVPHPYRIDWANDEMAGMFPTLWLPFLLECDKGKDYLSEDYAASARLTLAGVKQYMYTPQERLRHWGDFNFTL